MRFLVFTIAALAFTAFAQSPTAKVTGRVTDPSGAVVPAASIRITNLDTNISSSASTNDTGDYTIPYLNPGRYSLDASAAGFRAYRHTEFTLVVDQEQRIDIPLEVGAATETVTISDTPPAINTESGARGDVTSSREISEIPLEGRNFSDLAYLTGGVIPKGDGGDGQYAVNGARADNIAFMVDGQNNTQRRNTGPVVNLPIESVQEFKMMTSGYSAEFGRYAGGVLSVVTKSGTNRIRGSLYEFLRNDVWDATSYFDLTKSKLRRNQFGANLTGPVVIPKLYSGKNRTFFLFTWDTIKSIDGKTQRGIVPTPEMLTGDFTKATNALGQPLKINDTLAKAPFPGNIIPASRLDPVSLNMARYFPAANLTGSANNFVAQGNYTQESTGLGVKIDHNLSQNDRLTASTFWRPNSTFDPIVSGRSPLPIFGLSNETMEILSYLRYLKSLTPTMYLEANASFSRRTNNQLWPLSAEKDWASEVGFTGGTQNPIARGLPQFEATGYIILGPAYDVPKIWSYNNYQYSTNLTWIKGRHNLKAGGDFLRMQYFSRNYGDTRGRLQFNGRFTGHTLADMVLGWASSSRRQLDASGPYHHVSNYSAFLQDDIKVSSSLTLNIGVRYELMKPPREKYDALAMFLPSLGKVAIAGRGTLSQAEFDKRVASLGAQNVVMAADAGLPPSITETNWDLIAPRFGFAWRPFNHARTVLRGGYGIFYGASSLYRMDEYNDTFPFSITETFSVSSSNPALVTASNPFPSDRRGISGVTSSYGQENTRPKAQYLQSWNLTLERDFGRATVLEIAYAASKGTHLQRRYDINQPFREQGMTTLRPYSAFGSINIINDGSNSVYNSGSLTLRKNFAKQVFLRGAYTYSKSLDESSNTGGTIQYNFSAAQDSRNLKLERGRSDFDMGHTFTGSFIWTPSFSNRPIFKEWQVAGTAIFYSGPPFTPKMGSFDYTNGGASRPDRITSGKLDTPTVEQWFDRAAFPAVPLGAFRFGTSGRNVLDGPGTINLNLSLSKRIRFGESRSLQLRAESFNLPNHPNFNLPENRVDILSGGVISRAKNNRILQMGARLEF